MSEHYKNQKRSQGKFATDNPEPTSAKLTVRMTPTLRARIEAAAGNKVADWVREAIIEKLNKENSN